MRPAVSRIFETRADRASFRSTLRLRVVPGARFPPPAAIKPWDILVLLLMALVLVAVARDGIDLSSIPFTGWIHP
jgi:hypothetical protein